MLPGKMATRRLVCCLPRRPEVGVTSRANGTALRTNGVGTLRLRIREALP